jgi:hypothetical protein
VSKSVAFIILHHANIYSSGMSFQFHILFVIEMLFRVPALISNQRHSLQLKIPCIYLNSCPRDPHSNGQFAPVRDLKMAAIGSANSNLALLIL